MPTNHVDCLTTVDTVWSSAQLNLASMLGLPPLVLVLWLLEPPGDSLCWRMALPRDRGHPWKFVAHVALVNADCDILLSLLGKLASKLLQAWSRACQAAAVPGVILH